MHDTFSGLTYNIINIPGCKRIIVDITEDISIDMDGRVAVITGGNSGLGLAVAERLLQLYPGIHICLACRNKDRAQKAALSLKTIWPNADITLLLVDISNMASVYRAAEELKKRYDHIDYLYLNAGIMPVTVINWDNFIKGFFSRKCAHMLRTGEGLLKQKDSKTTDGLQSIFATNLFGHFVLVKELIGFNLGGNIPSQVIWTSSSNAKKSAFDQEDIQHKCGMEPYSSSKYASDALSVAMNNKYNKQGIYSHSICPGLVMTNLTYNILPSLFWWIVFPFLCLLRILVPSLNLSVLNGSEALVWSTKQMPESMDPMSKYCSLSTVLGNRYVRPRKMSIPMEVAEGVYDALDKMEKEIKGRCQKLY